MQALQQRSTLQLSLCTPRRQGEERYSSTTGVRSTSHPGYLTLKHDCTGGWRGSTAGLNVLEKKKYVSPPGAETQSIHPTVCSPYQLCYPSSGTVLYISIKNLMQLSTTLNGNNAQYFPRHSIICFLAVYLLFHQFCASDYKCTIPDQKLSTSTHG